MSGGGTTQNTIQNKDPWGPAQSYLKDNLAQNQRMQDYYSANPFSQEQKQAILRMMMLLGTSGAVQSQR